jgi:hypothetical protein
LPEDGTATSETSSFMRACGQLPSPYDQAEAYADLQGKSQKSADTDYAKAHGMADITPLDDSATSSMFGRATCSMPAGLSHSFAGLPDGALLRITASLDMDSGAALTSADRAARENTAAALHALSTGISEAHAEQRAATEAIQQEREAGREPTAEAARFAEVLGMLGPLFQSQSAQQRHGAELTDLEALIRENASTELTAAEEAALQAREVEAHEESHMREAALRAQVADGYLQQCSENVAPAAPDITSVASLDAPVASLDSPVALDGVATSRARDLADDSVSMAGDLSQELVDIPPSADNSIDSTVCSAEAASDGMALPQTQAPACSSVVDPSFACIPEGPLLHVAALMDLNSGMALNLADSAARESTADALRTLGEALALVKRDEEAATAAIEEERLAARQQQTAEGAAWAQALAILNPHRGHFERMGMDEQAAELFGMLQQGPQPQEQASDVEAAFEARITEAAALARAREAMVRSRVAEGELNAEVAM